MESTEPVSLFLSQFVGASLAWIVVILLIVKFITLRKTYSRSRNLLSSGFLICLCTAITAPFLNYCTSSLLLDFAKTQRTSSLSLEKLPYDTTEQQSYKNWRKTVDSIDTPIDMQEMKVNISTLVEPLYLIITIIGAGLGSTFLGMGVIENLPNSKRINLASLDYETNYRYEFKLPYNPQD